MSLRQSLRSLKTVDTTEKLGRTNSLNSVNISLLKADIVKQLNQSSDSKKKSLILLSTDAAATNSLLTGGKGSSLAVLNCTKGVDVPHFFCVTTEAYKSALSSLHIKSTLNELQELSNQYQKSQEQDKLSQLFVLSDKIRKVIEDMPLDRETEEVINLAYRNLCAQCNVKDLPVAVRSSATTEDLAEASFAGQHDTFLNQCGIFQVMVSIRRCWASLFTNRAVEYRNRHHIPHASAEMCVVIQEMVDPLVAGTSFSVEISTSYPAIHVAASYGLGEAVVSGEVTSDEWLLDPATLRVLKQVIGSKQYEIKKCNGQSGVEKLKVETARRKNLCLTYTQVKKIAKSTIKIKEVYKQLYGYQDIDTEFAFDEKGFLKLLQSRPLVDIGVNNIMTVDTKSGGTSDILLKGAYSLLGAVHGKVKVIVEFEHLVNNLVQIEEDDIIFTTKTGNYWNQYLTNLKGIVTIEGSPTAHPMLIGRERNLPVICGISGLGLLRQMSEYNGKWVTLDGLSKKIYLGKKKLKQASKDELFEQFSVVIPADTPSDEASLNFLKDFKRVYEDEDSNFWVYNPNSKINPVWRRIMLDMFPQRFKIVNACRTKKLVEDPFSKLVMIHNDKICDQLEPIKKTLFAWEGMSLPECVQYYNLCEDVCKQFLEACVDFSRGATPEKWNKYISMYHQIHAFMWMSYFWRVYLNMRTTEYASKLGVSQLHFNIMLGQAQEGLFQEDEMFRKEILEITLEIKPLLKGNHDNQLGGGALLMASMPQYQSRLERAAQYYSIDNECDILRPLPVLMVFKKVLETLDLSPFETDISTKVQETFFPEEKELHEWVNLLVAARVQHSNCHHWHSRGQCLIKQELLRIAKQEQVDLQQLFCQTPDDVKYFIERHNITSKSQDLNKRTNGWFGIGVGAFTGLAVGVIATISGQKLWGK